VVINRNPIGQKISTYIKIHWTFNPFIMLCAISDVSDELSDAYMLKSGLLPPTSIKYVGKNERDFFMQIGVRLRGGYCRFYIHQYILQLALRLLHQ